MQATFHSYVPIIVVLVYREGLFSEREAMSFFTTSTPGGGGGGGVGGGPRRFVNPNAI